MAEENNNSKNIIRISDKYIIDEDYLLRLENRLGETIRVGVIGKTDFKLLYEALVKCYEIWIKEERNEEE